MTGDQFNLFLAKEGVLLVLFPPTNSLGGSVKDWRDGRCKGLGGGGYKLCKGENYMVIMSVLVGHKFLSFIFQLRCRDLNVKNIGQRFERTKNNLRSK